MCGRRSRFASLQIIFVEHLLCDLVRRTDVPTRIVIEIEPDRGDGASSNVRAPPASGAGQEFRPDFEIRVLHRVIVARTTRLVMPPPRPSPASGGGSRARR